MAVNDRAHDALEADEWALERADEFARWQREARQRMAEPKKMGYAAFADGTHHTKSSDPISTDEVGEGTWLCPSGRPRQYLR